MTNNNDAEKPVLWIDISPTSEQSTYLSVYKIYVAKKTKYQDMWIVECGDYGKSLFLDGESQSAVNNEFYYHEALVHPACLLHGHPERILILGGGEGATVREALKWNSVKSILMIDIDSEVVDACKQFLPEMNLGSFNDPRVKVLFQDAVEFLETSDTKWDVIISDLPSPKENDDSYKLFDAQYLTLCQQLLNKDGVFVMQAGPTVPVNHTLHAKLASTVKAVFPNFLSYATLEGWGFVLGSNKAIKQNQDSRLVDRILAEQTTNDFRALDGIAINGMLNTPKYLRDAIASQENIFNINK